MREWFAVNMKAGIAGELLIYDAIGRSHDRDKAVGAQTFVEALGKLVKRPGDIVIRINSPGGNVAEGTAIYSAIRGISDRVVVQIDGWAASIASLIALAGRECRMSDVGQFMIHNPSSLAYGEAKELRKAAKMLDGVKVAMLKGYTRKSGLATAEVSKLMDATTWMDAHEAKRRGFVDVVTTETTQAPAAFNPEAWASRFAQGPQVTTLRTVAAKAGRVTCTAIQAACPGAPAAFVVAQMAAVEQNPGRSLADIQAMCIAENLRKAAEIQRARAALPKAPPPAPRATGFLGFSAGVDGGGEEAKATAADPLEAYEEVIDSHIAAGKTRQEAIRHIATKEPEINMAYLAAYNKAHGGAGLSSATRRHHTGGW